MKRRTKVGLAVAGGVGAVVGIGLLIRYAVTKREALSGVGCAACNLPGVSLGGLPGVSLSAPPAIIDVGYLSGLGARTKQTSRLPVGHP